VYEACVDVTICGSGGDYRNRQGTKQENSWNLLIYESCPHYLGTLVKD
jgi:hypothetical protein